MDTGKVSELLHIVERCAGHSGKLSFLSGAAMKELLKINEEVKMAAARDVEAEKEQVARAIPSTPEPEEERNIKPTEDTMVKPSVFPADSRTATIADRRV